MLPKADRLKTAPYFQDLFRSGRRFRTNHLLFLASPSIVERAKVGVVISKKIDKRAVGRNRLRRVLLHAIAELKGQYPGKWNRDMILVVTNHPGQQPFQSFTEQLQQWLAKV